MNTRYLFLSVLMLCCFLIGNAQQYVYVQTPAGSSVEGIIIQEEYTASEITTINNTYISGYPQATFLDDASKKYNCHSYAWYLSTGGTTICWINQFDKNGNPNISKYWTDGSYTPTTSTLAYKIFYYNGDHSATRSAVSGYYESKWGSAPLMRHAPNYGPPSYNMNDRNYYLPIATVEGPTMLTIPANANSVQGSFTTKQNYNVVMGDYEWTISGPGSPHIFDNRGVANIDFFTPGQYYITCRFTTDLGQTTTTPNNRRVQVVKAQSYSLIFDASSKTIALVSQGDKTQMAASATKGYAYQIANLSTGALVANGLIAPDGSKISVATLQPGIYVCKIQIDAETTLIEKLIIR